MWGKHEIEGLRDNFPYMRIKLREYKMTDYEQLEQLFYNTVHSVNAKVYTEE